MTSTGKFNEISVVDREKLVHLKLQTNTTQIGTDIVAEAVVALD